MRLVRALAVEMHENRLEATRCLNCCIGSPIDDCQYSQVISFNTLWTSNSLPSGVGPDNSALFVVTYVDFLVDGDPIKGHDNRVRYGSDTSEAADSSAIPFYSTRSSQPLCYLV